MSDKCWMVVDGEYLGDIIGIFSTEDEAVQVAEMLYAEVFEMELNPVLVDPTTGKQIFQVDMLRDGTVLYVGYAKDLLEVLPFFEVRPVLKYAADGSGTLTVLLWAGIAAQAIQQTDEVRLRLIGHGEWLVQEARIKVLKRREKTDEQRAIRRGREIQELKKQGFLPEEFPS